MLKSIPAMLGFATVILTIGSPAAAASLTAPPQARSTDYLLTASAPLASFETSQSRLSMEDGRQSPLLTTEFSPAPPPPGPPSGGTLDPRQSPPLVPEGIVSPIPEPATWALMMLGFGIIGSALRRRRGVPRLRSTFS
jgi:hypothetical protein